MYSCLLHTVILPPEWFIADLMAYPEQPCYAELVLDLDRLIADKNPSFTRLGPSLSARQAGKGTRWRLLINTDVEGDL